MRRKAPVKISSRRRKYVLTGGIAICGKCRAALEGQAVKNGRSYQCGSCHGVRIMADELEQLVAAKVLGTLATPAGRDELRNAFTMYSDTQSLTEKVEALREEQAELGKAYREEGMSLAAFKAADREITDEIETVEAYMDRVSHLAPLSTGMTAEQMAMWWDLDSTIDQRHALILIVVERVVVHPVGFRGFNAVNTDRVEVVFR